MFRQKCSYRNDIEIRKKPKNKETKDFNFTKKKKLSYLLKLLVYDASGKIVTSHSKSFLLLL